MSKCKLICCKEYYLEKRRNKYTTVHLVCTAGWTRCGLSYKPDSKKRKVNRWKGVTCGNCLRLKGTR